MERCKIWGTTRIHIRPTIIQHLHKWFIFFIENTKLANYAGDNATYSTGKDIETLLCTLQTETSKVLKWFHDNEMKSNDFRSGNH